MKLDGQDLLTTKQAAAIKAIRRLCKKEGLMVPTAGMITEAHLEAYDIGAKGCGDEKEARHVARTIGARNLTRPAFRAALGIDSDEAKSYLAEQLWENLQGTNPRWPKDKDLYRLSLKLLARLVFDTRTNVVVEEDRFSKLTNEELEAIARGDMEIPKSPEAPCVSGWLATRKGQGND